MVAVPLLRIPFTIIWACMEAGGRNKPSLGPPAKGNERKARKSRFCPNWNLTGTLYHGFVILRSLVYSRECTIELGQARSKRIFQGSLTLVASFEFAIFCQKIILDRSVYGFGNARVSSGKLCAGAAKIWLFGPHSACSLIQPKLFASFIFTASRESCAASVLELQKFS